jgi:putative hydrolase of the HAD superfamily
LDGTLYAIENGYEDACRARVFSFMVDELGFENANAAKNAWRPQFAKYNQTLKALRAGLGLEFDTETYWTRTRGDPRAFLTPNAEARESLRRADAARAARISRAEPGSLNGLKKLKKYVLTNCAEKQAKESLAALGLLDAFDGVFGADAMGDTCKPCVEAFRRVQKIAGFDYARTAFFEDSVKNLAAAKTLGATTVLVASATAREEGTRSDGFEPDHVVAAVTPAEMARVLPGVFLG